MPRTIVYSEWVEEQREHSSLDITMPDGSIVNVPPPALWDKDVFEQAQKAQADPDSICRALLGEDGFEKFVAAGGRPMALTVLVQKELGGRLGE